MRLPLARRHQGGDEVHGVARRDGEFVVAVRARLVGVRGHAFGVVEKRFRVRDGFVVGGAHVARGNDAARRLVDHRLGAVVVRIEPAQHAPRRGDHGDVKFRSPRGDLAARADLDVACVNKKTPADAEEQRLAVAKDGVRRGGSQEGNEHKTDEKWSKTHEQGASKPRKPNRARCIFRREGGA